MADSECLVSVEAELGLRQRQFPPDPLAQSSSDTLIADPAPSSPPPEPIKALIAKAAKLIPRSLNSLARENIADLYLQEQGIEIGALHHLLVVPKDVKVLYVDRMSVADLQKQYPELNDLPLIEADILANGEILKRSQIVPKILSLQTISLSIIKIRSELCFEYLNLEASYSSF